MRLARALPLVGGGFLLSVLWFDLKFDVLVIDRLTSYAAIDPASLAGLRAYYAQALGTENAGFPLISTMMCVSVLARLWQLRAPGGRGWSAWVSLALLVPPIALAGARIVPNAGTLAYAQAPLTEQEALATSILVDHLYCFASIAAFLVFELARLHFDIGAPEGEGGSSGDRADVVRLDA